MGKRRMIGVVILLLVMVFVTPFSCLAGPSDKISVYFEESLNYEAVGNYDASFNSVLRVLRVDVKHYTATLRAGWLSYLKGDHVTSEKYYRKAILLAGDAIEPKLGLLLPLMASKKWAEADAAARAVLTLDEKNYLAASKLAYALFEQGKYGDARIMYQKILDWYPSDLGMRLGLGWTYQRMGKKDEGSRCFREVLEVNRHNQSALAGMEAIRSGK